MSTKDVPKYLVGNINNPTHYNSEHLIFAKQIKIPNRGFFTQL